MTNAENANTALDKCLDWSGHAWNSLSHYDDAFTSHIVESRNISSLQVSSPFKRYREKSHASGKRKETWQQGAGKGRVSTSFPSLVTASKLACSRVRLRLQIERLARLLPGHIRPHSHFREPVNFRNSEVKFELFTYQATSTMTPRLLFAHFDQPVTINSTTSLTLAHAL